ncbi:unnamed protein product [Tuber melanosporum]|uniref:(Perigord truffle) hypothetical protein n=1 Tax=Tuber melanosporum (strain Mel28) TaxID=656061 RepID=D5G575_TUBMM|nr:uncharacterized protein GSTUM_00000342001 [Tuber melanosporum]CAZ79668.1 unnamed protein product [Tuber melanosporum]
MNHRIKPEETPSPSDPRSCHSRPSRFISPRSIDLYIAGRTADILPHDRKILFHTLDSFNFP